MGGADSVLQLWVNGTEVGISKDSRLEAEFDLTELVRFDAPNLLAARGRAVVRRVVRRGPGPVVARGHPPRGVPLQHAAHVPPRRARDRVTDARSHHRYPRPARQRQFDETERADSWVVAARCETARGRAVTTPEFRGPVPRCTRRVPVRRPHRALAHADRRRHSLVRRGTQPLPVAGRAARSRRQPARHRDDLDRVPAHRDQGSRLPRQRQTDPAARREPSRLRS